MSLPIVPKADHGLICKGAKAPDVHGAGSRSAANLEDKSCGPDCVAFGFTSRANTLCGIDA